MFGFDPAAFIIIDMSNEPTKPKPARYQYVAAAILGGLTALIGLAATAAFIYFVSIGKPPMWKLLAFGVLFMIIAAIRVWTILRVPREKH